MSERQPPSKGLNIALWVVQVLLALTLAGTGIWKFVTPVAKLAAVFPWMGQVSPSFLYMTAAFDFLGGVGVFVPWATGILPRLSALAALGCAALQLGAIAFHFSRGEGSNTPFNFFLVGLSLFVAWGRRSHKVSRSTAREGS